MTPAPSLAFPSSRALAGWWRQLAPLRPRALWVAHLFLHRVEALARLRRPERLDPFRRTVLQGLAVAAERTVAGLDAGLHLGPPVLRQVLEGLRAEGLARPDAAGVWAATPLGAQAVEQGSYPRPGYERRVFPFVENRTGPPRFLHLAGAAAAPMPAPEGWHFDAGLLSACVQQPAEWKQKHGFPLDVEHVLGAGDAEAPDWQRVVLDRPEHLLAAVVLVPGPEEGRLLGFAVRQEGWALPGADPAFAVDAGWAEVFPDLAQEPPVEAWRQAWRAWAQPRGLPLAEVEACTLERREHLLRVLAPKKLLDRLRSARSDALKGEAWLLAGSDNVRPAAQVEVQEAVPGRAPAG